MESIKEIKSLYIIGTILMFIMAIAVIVIVLLYQNHFFKMKKGEAEKLLITTLNAQKEERYRLASDLHDGLLSDLNAIKNFIYLFSENKNMFTNENINLVYDSVNEAINNAKRISYSIKPPMLKEMGVIAAFEFYIENLKKINKINIEIEKKINQFDIEETTSYELYRILQEIVANQIKYSNATLINVKFSTFGKNNKIYIIDNGVFFDFYKNLEKSKTLGLLNITNRIKVINAKFNKNFENNCNTYTIEF